MPASSTRARLELAFPLLLSKRVQSFYRDDAVPETRLLTRLKIEYSSFPYFPRNNFNG